MVMLVISDIHPDDAYYTRRKLLLGKEVNTEKTNLRPSIARSGWKMGEVYLKENDEYHYFAGIKLKKVKNK